MLFKDFPERAANCMRFAQLTHSPRDRALFIEMAHATSEGPIMAWNIFRRSTDIERACANAGVAL
jgi:hypothetical protein